MELDSTILAALIAGAFAIIVALITAWQVGGFLRSLQQNVPDDFYRGLEL